MNGSTKSLDIAVMSNEEKAKLQTYMQRQVVFAVLSSRRRDASCFSAFVSKDEAARAARKIGGVVKPAHVIKDGVWLRLAPVEKGG